MNKQEKADWTNSYYIVLKNEIKSWEGGILELETYCAEHTDAMIEEQRKRFKEETNA